MAGMSFGVFILVNRQMGNAIRTARNRHRHTILLIGSVRCYHPFSFLEPGGRSLFAFHNHLKTEKAAPQDCFLYGNINFSRDFSSKVTTFPADSRFSLSFIWCSMSILRTEQEIRYVHCLDSLIVPTGKFVCCENKFGVIIRYFKQAAIMEIYLLLYSISFAVLYSLLSKHQDQQFYDRLPTWQLEVDYLSLQIKLTPDMKLLLLNITLLHEA